MGMGGEAGDELVHRVADALGVEPEEFIDEWGRVG